MIALLSCLNPWDEVIVPAMSHTATSHAVEYTGAKTIFVDIDFSTGNIDPEKIVNKITIIERPIWMMRSYFVLFLQSECNRRPRSTTPLVVGMNCH